MHYPESPKVRMDPRWRQIWRRSNKKNENLRISLDRCGLLCNEIGITYQSDHILANGAVPESALDHVYSSKSLEDKLEVKKLENGSSDHNPVVASICKKFQKKMYTKSTYGNHWTKNGKVSAKSMNFYASKPVWRVTQDAQMYKTIWWAKTVNWIF